MDLSEELGLQSHSFLSAKLKEILPGNPNLMWLLTSLEALAPFDTVCCFLASLRCVVAAIPCQRRSLKTATSEPFQGAETLSVACYSHYIIQMKDDNVKFVFGLFICNQS